jgi:hypothetical protein
VLRKRDVTEKDTSCHCDRLSQQASKCCNAPIHAQLPPEHRKLYNIPAESIENIDPFASTNNSEITVWPTDSDRRFRTSIWLLLLVYAEGTCVHLVY